MSELPDTAGFAAASRYISPEMVARHISCGPSLEHHLKAVNRYVEAGYDHIILVQIEPEQDAFLDFFKRELARTLDRQKAAQ